MPSRPLLLLCVFALTACQQVAWKAGGNAEDLKRDEHACHTQVTSGDDETVKQCLRGKGWTVTDFKSSDAESAANTEAAAESPATGAIVLPAAITPAATDNNSSPQTSTTPTAHAATVKHQPKDPLQRQSIQTWWKAGAQASDFKTDESACLTQLGEQHTPDYAQHLYTRALVSCLKTRGWYAGHDPVYTPLR